MEKFRWLYIGNGNIAVSTARSIQKGEHEITAVYGRNKEKARAFAKKHGAEAFDDVLEAIKSAKADAAYIATPHTSHVEYALLCMENGLPVLCEKPVGISEKEVDTLISSSVKNGVYFAEAMWTWFSDVALTVKDWVTGGRIGKIKSVVIHYSFPGVLMPKTSRVLMPETAGGGLLDIGIYPITYCYNIFGYPKNIICDGKVRNGIDIKEKVILDYGDFRCKLYISLLSAREGCVIKGTDGKIVVPMFHMASRAVLKSTGENSVFSGKTDYLTEFTRVAEEIRQGKKQSGYVPFGATKDCMRIMDECRRQMRLIYPCEKE